MYKKMICMGILGMLSSMVYATDNAQMITTLKKLERQYLTRTYCNPPKVIAPLGKGRGGECVKCPVGTRYDVLKFSCKKKHPKSY